MEIFEKIRANLIRIKQGFISLFTNKKTPLLGDGISNNGRIKGNRRRPTPRVDNNRSGSASATRNIGYYSPEEFRIIHGGLKTPRINTQPIRPAQGSYTQKTSRKESYRTSHSCRVNAQQNIQLPKNIKKVVAIAATIFIAVGGISKVSTITYENSPSNLSPEKLHKRLASGRYSTDDLDEFTEAIHKNGLSQLKQQLAEAQDKANEENGVENSKCSENSDSIQTRAAEDTSDGYYPAQINLFGTKFYSEEDVSNPEYRNTFPRAIDCLISSFGKADAKRGAEGMNATELDCLAQQLEALEQGMVTIQDKGNGYSEIVVDEKTNQLILSLETQKNMLLQAGTLLQRADDRDTGFEPGD